MIYFIGFYILIFSAFAAATPYKEINYIKLISDIQSGVFLPSEERAYRFTNAEDYTQVLWGDDAYKAKTGAISRWEPLVLTDTSKINDGWKFHIIATEENKNAVARVVVPFLLHRNIDCKIVSGPHFEHFLSTETLDQHGKFITIYPRNYDDAKRVANELIELIEQHISIGMLPSFKEEDILLTAPGDAYIPEGKGYLRLRYGAINSDAVMIHNADGIALPQVLSDLKSFPFPEFIWSYNSKALGGDTRLFPDLTLKWIFPGTDKMYTLNNKEIKSWLDVISPLKYHSVFPFMPDNIQISALITYENICQGIKEHLTAKKQKNDILGIIKKDVGRFKSIYGLKKGQLLERFIEELQV